MSKTFQEVCGFKLGDDLCISGGGQLSVVENVVLRDVTANEEGTPELGEADRPHWEWFLRESLSRSFFSHVGARFRLGQAKEYLDFHAIRISKWNPDNETICILSTKWHPSSAKLTSTRSGRNHLHGDDVQERISQGS